MKTNFWVSITLCVVLAAVTPLFGRDFSWQSNPLATPDQLTAEKNAMQIVQTAAVQEAKAQLMQKWLAVAGDVSAEQMALLQEAVDEIAFQSAVAVQNNDPNYPKMMSILLDAHHWYGMDVPGSRSVFDNPDTIYDQIPIDPAMHYVIKGKHLPETPVDENFSLWDARNSTITNLSGDNLIVERDGSFTITIDSSVGDGKHNHLQTTPQVAKIFIRNTVTNWAKQSFDLLSIQRIEPPSAPPASFDQWVSMAAAGIPNMINNMAYFQQRVNATPVNTMPPITMGGTSGMLATQAQEYSPWRIADDEALIVTVNPAGAGYIICPVYDKWFITTDPINHTQTLNNSQAIPNPDGTYTFVIAVKDPGVYNWVDTVGMHEGTLNLRWQDLPSTPQNGGPSATMQFIKLSDLPAAMPAGTKYITPLGRRLQVAIRAASFARRFDENWVPPLYALDVLTWLLQQELRTGPAR